MYWIRSALSQVNVIVLVTESLLSDPECDSPTAGSSNRPVKAAENKAKHCVDPSEAPAPAQRSWRGSVTCSLGPFLSPLTAFSSTASSVFVSVFISTTMSSLVVFSLVLETQEAHGGTGAREQNIRKLQRFSFFYRLQWMLEVSEINMECPGICYCHFKRCVFGFWEQ